MHNINEGNRPLTVGSEIALQVKPASGRLSVRAKFRVEAIEVGGWIELIDLDFETSLFTTAEELERPEPRRKPISAVSDLRLGDVLDLPVRRVMGNYFEPDGRRLPPRVALPGLHRVRAIHGDGRVELIDLLDGRFDTTIEELSRAMV